MWKRDLPSLTAQGISAGWISPYHSVQAEALDQVLVANGKKIEVALNISAPEEILD